MNREIMVMVPSYYRILPGIKNRFAEQCIKEGWLGGDWDIKQDLSRDLPQEWRQFNEKFIPLYLTLHPEKSRVAAGLACGMLHTICKGIKQGSVVLCPDGKGAYRAGTFEGNYYYVSGEDLPHRRKVKWFARAITPEEMSEPLRRSVAARGTVCQINKHGEEINRLLNVHIPQDLVMADETVENSTAFALEEHLEEFLVKNWSATKLGKNYDIYHDEGELIGQQYRTDTGPMDILARRKDGKELLVVELKKGRASDAVVGQVQRYMGFVQAVLAEPDQMVRGCIIALEDDLRLKRALSVTSNIDFYRYQVKFNLLQE